MSCTSQYLRFKDAQLKVSFLVYYLRSRKSLPIHSFTFLTLHSYIIYLTLVNEKENELYPQLYYLNLTQQISVSLNDECLELLLPYFL